MPNTIKLKSYLDVIEEINAANDGLFPGRMVELNSNGKVQEHSSSASIAVPMFALEDELQGNGVDDTYAADDPVQVWIPARGDQVWAVLADGENVSIGDFLQSDGSGNLQQGTSEAVGVALEAIDLSQSSGAESSSVLGFNRRIKIRVL